MAFSDDESLSQNKLFENIEDDKTLVYVTRLFAPAKQGDNSAIYEIGEEYSRHQKYDKAMDWYQLAASRKYTPAMYDIGALYQHGRGVPVDYFLSMEWLLKAANGDHKDAFYNIGLQFQFGWGVQVDISRAMEWFYKYHEESTNLEDLMNEGHVFTEQQKEKPIKSMIFEAEITLKVEKLHQEKEKLHGDMTNLHEECQGLKKDINLINGRVTLLKDENKVIWDELEKTKTETTKKVDGLERHVEQLVELLRNQNISV